MKTNAHFNAMQCKLRRVQSVTTINRKLLLPHFPNPTGSIDHSDWTSLVEGGMMYCSSNSIGPLFVMGGACQAGALSCDIRHFAVTAVR